MDDITTMQDLANLCFRQKSGGEAESYLHRTVATFEPLISKPNQFVAWKFKEVQYCLPGNAGMAKYCYEKILSGLEPEDFPDRAMAVQT